MSRARPLILPTGDTIWFDQSQAGQKATDSQLALLVAVTDIDLDDLLDEHITQGQLLAHLREALGQGSIPTEVVNRQEEFRKQRQVAPECRCCGRPGNSTKHHFVNKWIMKELSNYEQVAARSKCCIPVCIECHRDLHDRSNGAVSIVPYLTPREREFAKNLIERLRKEKPSLFALLSEGSDSVYEARLIRDWIEGHFDH